MDRDFQAIILILATWIIVFFVHTHYARRFERTLKRISRRLVRAYKRRGIQRLCGYHVGYTLRPGMIALLDSDNCEECIRETRES